MAKPGVEYDEVARVADAMLAKGVEPTNRLVLAEVGGSATTVHKHLKNWRAAHPQAAQAPPELPAGLQRAIQEELRRQQAEARSEIEARLVTTQAEAEDLARAAERAESEVEQLSERVAGLTGDRDRLTGQLNEQQRETARLNEALNHERAAAESGRVEIAQARLKTEAAEAAASTLREERAEQLRTLEAERTARIGSERKLASAEAARDELRKSAEQMVATADEVEAERDRLRDLLERERELHSQTRSTLAAEQEKARAAEKRAEDLSEREAALRKELAEMRRGQGKSTKSEKGAGTGGRN